MNVYLICYKFSDMIKLFWNLVNRSKTISLNFRRSFRSVPESCIAISLLPMCRMMVSNHLLINRMIKNSYTVTPQLLNHLRMYFLVKDGYPLHLNFRLRISSVNVTKSAASWLSYFGCFLCYLICLIHFSLHECK